MRDRPHDDAMAELFQQDPTFAVDILNAVLADGDQAELNIFLRQFALAFGGAAGFDDASLHGQRQRLPAVSKEANAALDELFAILQANGLRLDVSAIPAQNLDVSK